LEISKAMGRVLLSRLVVFASLSVSGCTLQQAEIPPLAGPSEFADSLSLSATPDSIVQDGFSQSSVLITARNVSGQGDSNVQLHLSLSVDGSPVNFGSLSAYTVYTGSDGKARVQYTAPTASPFAVGGPPRRVTIYATAVGTNQMSSMRQAVTLLVTPPSAPPTEFGAPTARVTYSPAAPKVGALVTFNASQSSASSGSIVSYVWDFGDDTFNDEHGVDASHVYGTAGTYTMILGVIDENGRLGSDIKTIVVTK
jgi:PKD repeat protein